jgi:hypothetical protein
MLLRTLGRTPVFLLPRVTSCIRRWVAYQKVDISNQINSSSFTDQVRIAEIRSSDFGVVIVEAYHFKLNLLVIEVLFSRFWATIWIRHCLFVKVYKLGD